MTTAPDALVLGGGGSVGIAWELGMLAGVEESRADVLDHLRASTTALTGTSAGSIVAVNVASGLPMSELICPDLEFVAGPRRSSFGRLIRLVASMALANAGRRSPEETRRRIGALAVRAETMSAAEWRTTIRSRLPMDTWPEEPVVVTAVDVESGELRVFDRHSGVDLVDAVSASCAVPGVFPPVRIDGRLYMDGGMRSIANADLAAGSARVLVLAPLLRSGGMGSIAPAELAALGAARVLVVSADAAARTAFGRNPLDASTRPASAAAGQNQGRRMADEIGRFWDGTS